MGLIERINLQLSPLSAAGPAPQMPTRCVKCGSSELGPDANVPLCEPCRVVMLKFPFPQWVKISALVILGLLVISLVQLPERWSTAVRLQHGRKMALRGRWDDAFASLKPFKEDALNASDIDFSLDYCEAAAESGHFDDAEAILKRLAGHRASKGQVKRAESLGRTVRMMELNWHPPVTPPLTADRSLYDRITSQ